MVDLLRHNQEAYEKVKEILQTNNKTCIIQPTGSGKSYLILKLIEDYAEQGKDIIVIEPQKYIFEQLQKKIDKYGLPNDNVKFLAYSALGKLDNEKIQQFNSPNMVIVDEMHSTGAPIWGSGLKMMFKTFSSDCKYIGFSATPIRFLDNQRNMADELFDGCIANEIDLADAILNRILPLPRYIAGLYNYSNEVSVINTKICQSYNSEQEKKKLLEEVAVMKRNLDKGKGISSIFKKYIDRNKGKFVAFFKNINHLRQMKPCLEEWFSEAGISCNYYEVHCKNPEKDKQFNAFMDDDKLAVCLSVGMLSEGIHGIDGVILLRDLMSPNLYYQQIGRVFSADMDTVPIIFDLVANCESIMNCNLKNDLLNAIQRKDKDNINENSTEITQEDIENFFVFDQVVDAISVFKSIEKRLVDRWEYGLKCFDKYVREHNGDVLVPLKYRDEDGFLLGNWVSNNRSDFKSEKLSVDKIDELNRKGFVWDVLQYNFDNNMKALEQYKEREGDCLVPGNHVEVVNGINVNLGIWCKDIRSAKNEKSKRKKITKEMENKLDQLGFVWNVHKYNYANGLVALKQYCEREGNCLVPGNHVEIIENGTRVNLGIWVKNIRGAKKGRNGWLLLPEQIQELEQLGFVFNQHKYSFEKQVIDVKRFILASGYYPKFSTSSESEDKLARFVLTERGNKRKAEKANKRYPQWKIDIIENERLYDFFDEKESAFDRFYRMALVYKKRYGHTNIKCNDIIDGYNIGMIYQSLIKECKYGKLSDVEIQKLQDIDIDVTLGKHKKRFNETMQLAKQAISQGIVISNKNQIYQNVNLYSWYIIHKKQFSEEDMKVLDKLMYDGRNKSIKIIDARTDQIIDIYPSVNKAGDALCEKYHIANSCETGRLIIQNRLTGKTKKEIYKDRFKFEYVKSINKKYNDS